MIVYKNHLLLSYLIFCDYQLNSLGSLLETTSKEKSVLKMCTASFGFFKKLKQKNRYSTVALYCRAGSVTQLVDE